MLVRSGFSSKTRSFAPRTAARVQIGPSRLGIDERHGIDRLETVAARQQRFAGVLKGTCRGIADRNPDPRRRRVLRPDGIVEIVLPSRINTAGTGVVPRLPVVADPGHVLEIQHRAVTLPSRHVRRGEGEEAFPPAVAPREVVKTVSPSTIAWGSALA